MAVTLRSAIAAIAMATSVVMLTAAQAAPAGADASPTRLAGKVVLIVGDSHLVRRQHLIEPLYKAFSAQGATVYAYGSCGATPSEFLRPAKTDCGRSSLVPRSELAVMEGVQSVWDLRQLIKDVHPDRVVVVIGDTLGAYRQKAFPKSWVWDEVTLMTGVLNDSHLACTWVGPPWGRSGGAYGKTPERVEVLSKYLSEIVAPCDYVDTTRLARPGEWGSYDGQHLDAGAYKAWAAGIAQAMQTGRAPGVSGSPDKDDPWQR
jgi:hypothetical protein